MSRAWLMPHVVFPLVERVGRRRMWTEAQRLRRLQWEPADALERRTLARLRTLLDHATTHVPYYRDLFARAGVDAADVETAGDLARVPLTTKSDLRSAFPSRTTADNLPPGRRRAMRTSGSTGLPFEFYWDRANADEVFGTYLASLEWAGVALWDTRVAVLVPAAFATNAEPVSPARELARRLAFGERTVRLVASDLTLEAFTALLERLGRRRYFLRGYPSAIAHLAALITADGRPLGNDPAAVITYAETLTAVNAAHIRAAFRCPVVNVYTSWDVGHIAQTCPDNPEVLHVNSDRVLVRIVRPDGSTAARGETGRVVVTDLANHVMPFINYVIGDRAAAGEPCGCGRGWPTLAHVEGRDTEVIRTQVGKRVSSVTLGNYLTFVVNVVPHVWEYQAVQVAPETIVLRVVPTPRFTPEFSAKLRGDLESFLGPGMTVTVEVVDRIPLEASGKRLIIKT
jgi:phenylacetate-CoA ligase